MRKRLQAHSRSAPICCCHVNQTSRQGFWFPANKINLAILCWLASISPPAARAAIVQLQPVADTSLHELAPTNNMGAHTHVAAGSTAHAASRSRGLFRFDLQSAVPSSAVVNSASLTLRVTGTPFGGGADSTFGLHRLLRLWGEGNKVGNTGMAASPDEATWMARFTPSDLWTSPGGEAAADFVAQESSSIAVAGIGAYTFDSTPEIVADVQAWVSDPAANSGWILISQSEEVSQTARRFGSREDAANAPVLVVDYSASTPAEPPRMSGMILTESQVTFQFTAEAQRSYTVESSPSLSPPDWQVLSNYPAPPADTNLQMSDPITAGQRFYRVRAQ